MASRGKARGAIIGLGHSELSRRHIGSARHLAVAAVDAAIADSGLRHRDIDGLLINRSPLAPHEVLPLKLQEDLQLDGLRLLTSIEGEGSSAVQMIQYAALAIEAGMATKVACVFADDPLGAATTGGQAFSPALGISGIEGWEEHCGLHGAAGAYALAAREYLWHYGLDDDALGGVALSDRAWARLNPDAFLRQPLSMDDYLRSPWVVEPFRVLDCAYPVNGSIAVIVSSADAAADLAERPVYVYGMGQGHRGFTGFGRPGEPLTGAAIAGGVAFDMAGVSPEDVSACQFYEAFSFTTLLALEEYGLCPPGGAADFVRGGNTAPGGRLPCNTGGGHLSGFYLQGMTPVAEAVVQVRGLGGERQLDDPGLMLVTGNGGRLDYHAALLVGRNRSIG
ncbi:thiolase family protein [Thauera sinica]|uniref:Thiolase family protein n=1 Tax=Thauera sinica TaxID=2665146 RepID=A0ABW1ANU4_9RHOO|nr:thiolase family protein [Thauera sp. K11]ATE62031.1 thiolase [Thauera sp. K11]